MHTIAHSHNVNKMRSVGDIMYGLFAYPTRFIADTFFACSQEAGVSRYGKKIGNVSQRCVVLRNAIDTDRFVFSSDARQAIRHKLNLTEKQIVVGNISRFSEQKNHTFLLDVFAEIHKSAPTSVLLLVGDGDLRSRIEQKIVDLGLKDAVILTGIQSNTWDYYQAMDVFVMPSLYEGLPVSLVEAQTAGLPCCVSSAVPAESAITGLVRFRSLEESAEQWASWVLECSETPRKNMRDAIRSAGYDIATTSKWLEDFYTKVVSSRG
jgi:glycosyltransferase involved in cell wall biosynthesis